MFLDSHIHLNDEKLLTNLELYLKEAIENGVNKFLCVGWDVESSKIAVDLANKYENIYAAIGIIPTSYKTYNKDSISKLKTLFTKSKKIVCIGEIGLDYYWENSEEVKNIQQKMFVEQIKLANDLNLPISIHSRDALNDTLNILKKYNCVNKGVMHCYSGSKEMVKDFIDLGYYISFSGVITFKNAIKTKESIKGTPLNKILIETDGPYLAPHPYRGKINEPKYIVNTYKEVANLLNLDLDELCKIVYNNYNRLFTRGKN